MAVCRTSAPTAPSVQQPQTQVSHDNLERHEERKAPQTSKSADTIRGNTWWKGEHGIGATLHAMPVAYSIEDTSNKYGNLPFAA